MGAIRPIFAASTAPVSDDSSQGCATAVGTGGNARARCSSRSYFSCLRSIGFLLDATRLVSRRLRQQLPVVLRDELGYKITDLRYELVNQGVLRAWDRDTKALHALSSKPPPR